MIAMPSTLGQLKRAVEAMIEASGGEDTEVGGGEFSDATGGHDVGVSLELVYVKVGRADRLFVVGDEAGDYKPQPGDRPFVIVR